MAELFKVNAPVRKPLFEGVQGENEARSIQFDVTPWVEELGDGAVTATAKRSQDSQPYPVTVTKDGTTVTWKPTSTDTAFAGVGSFQLEYTVDDVLAKTCIWSTMVAPSLDPAGDPPDPYDNWLAEMRQIAADAIQAAQDADESADDAQAEVYEAEAWAKGTKNGTPVPSTADQYQNNAKYWAEQSLANQYGAFIVKSASGDIASFNDGADNIPMKSVNVTITPKQVGSGDPSPSNVRAITGWADADVKRTGANILKTDKILGWNNVQIVDGTVTATRTDTRSWNPVLQAYKDNTFVRNLGTGIQSPFAFTKDDTFNRLMFGHSGATADIKCQIELNDIPNGDYYFSWEMISSTGTFSWHNMMISTTATAYEPYTGHTTSVPLGQTVYGGTVNPISGELKITHAFIAYDGVSNRWWGKSSTYPGSFYTTMGSAYRSLVACTHAKNIGTVTSSTYVQGACGTDSPTNLAFNIRIAQASTTQAEWKQYLADQYANGTPLCAVFELATPTTVQLTPTQVASLLGTNNVWADCGSVAVEYRADPTLAYAELEALILENI